MPTPSDGALAIATCQAVCSMSALGHKRTFSKVCAMSALHPKTDIFRRWRFLFRTNERHRTLRFLENRIR